MLHEAFDDFPDFRDPDGGVWVWDSESHSYSKKPGSGLEQDRGHATGGDNDLFSTNQIEHSEQAGVPELEGYMSAKREWAPAGQVLCPQCSEATTDPMCPQCGKDLTPEWNQESDKNNEFFGIHDQFDNRNEFTSDPERVPKRNREKTDDSYPSMSLSKVAAGWLVFAEDWDDDNWAPTLEGTPEAEEAWQKRVPFLVYPNGQCLIGKPGQQHGDLNSSHLGPMRAINQGQLGRGPEGNFIPQWPVDPNTMAQPDWLTPQQQNTVMMIGKRQFRHLDKSQKVSSVILHPEAVYSKSPEGDDLTVEPMDSVTAHFAGDPWLAVNAASLDSCPECNDVMNDQDGEKVCHGCGHKQPIIVHEGAVLAPLGEAAMGGLAEMGAGAGAEGAGAAAGAGGGSGLGGIGGLMNKAMSGNPLANAYYTDKLMGGGGEQGGGGGGGGAAGGTEQTYDPTQIQGVLGKAQMQREAGIWGGIIEHLVNMLQQGGEAAGNAVKAIPGAMTDPRNPLSYIDDVAGAAGGVGSQHQQFSSTISPDEAWGLDTRVAFNPLNEFRTPSESCPECGGEFNPLKAQSPQSCDNCFANRPIAPMGNNSRGYGDIIEREKAQKKWQPVTGPIRNALGAFGNDDVGTATQNRGENSDPEHDGSGASFKEKGDSPELLKDVDGPGDAKGDAFPEDDLGNQGDPEMQQKALKSFHMNLPLVIEFAHSDEAGADNPIIQALDALLEEAFPGYKDGNDDTSEQTEHPADEAEKPEDDDKPAKSEDESGSKPDDGDSKTSAEQGSGMFCPECDARMGGANKCDKCGFVKGQDKPDPKKTAGYFEIDAARSDYDHHNEDADRMWWEEEGKHQGDPNEQYVDPDQYDHDQGAEDAFYDDLYQQMQGMSDGDLQAAAQNPSNYFSDGDDKTIIELIQHVLGDRNPEQALQAGGEQPGQGFPAQPDVHTAFVPMAAPGTPQVPGAAPGAIPGAVAPANQMTAPVCPMCGQTHAPGTACPAPAAATVTAPAATGQPITPPQPNTVVTKWHVVSYQNPGYDLATCPQCGVSGINTNGGICPHCGYNEAQGQAPTDPSQLLDQTMPGHGQTVRDTVSDLGRGTGPTMAAVDDEFAFYASSDEPQQEHTEDHHPETDESVIADDNDPTDIDSSSDSPWKDESGAPIQEGQDYELKANSYAIPDRVTIDRILPDKVQYTLHSGDVEYQDEVTKEQLDLDGVSFAPVGGGDAPMDSSDGFENYEAPVRPGQDATPQVDDLSTPSTVVSSTEFEPLTLDNYTGSYRGDAPDDRTWLMEDSSPVAVDPELMAKFAAKDFTAREQREFIDESGEARNLDRLDLEGTHYVMNDVDAHFNW